MSEVLQKTSSNIRRLDSSILSKFNLEEVYKNQPTKYEIDLKTLFDENLTGNEGKIEQIKEIIDKNWFLKKLYDNNLLFFSTKNVSSNTTKSRSFKSPPEELKKALNTQQDIFEIINTSINKISEQFADVDGSIPKSFLEAITNSLITDQDPRFNGLVIEASPVITFIIASTSLENYYICTEQKARLCFIDHGSIGTIPTIEVVFHELSHAVDDLRNDYGSLKDVLKAISDSNIISDEEFDSIIDVAMTLSATSEAEVACKLYKGFEENAKQYYGSTGSNSKKHAIDSWLNDKAGFRDAKTRALAHSAGPTEFLAFHVENVENIFSILTISENAEDFKARYKEDLNAKIAKIRNQLVEKNIPVRQQNKIIGNAIGIVAASMYEYTKVIIKGHEHEEFAKCLMAVPEILQDIRSEECPGITFPPITTHKASSSSHDQVSSNLSSNSQIPNAQEGDSESGEDAKTREPLKKRQRLTLDQNASVLAQPQVTEEITPQNIHDNLNALFHNFNPTGVAKIDGDVLLFNSNCNTNGVSVSSPNWIAIPNANIASIQEIVSSNDDLETKRSSIFAIINSQTYPSNHLRLSTKSNLQETTKTSKPNLKQLLEHHYQSLDSQEKLQLEELTETITLSEEKSIQDSNDIFLSPNNKLEKQNSSTKPKIQLLPESDHKIDHPNHIENLLARIDSLTTPQEGKANNIIIVLERKQEGKNLGMPDVILLAELIKKEEKLNQEKLDDLPRISLIPDNIRNSLIYQDALLYKAAEEKGIKVIGIDKAKISAQKKPDQEGYDPKGYNEEREAHMIDMIVTISNIHPNHNIIFPVGASHIENISVALEARSLSVDIDSVSNQENVVKTSRFTDRLGTELDVTNAGLVALQQRMQLRSVSVETLNKSKAITQENAVPESHVDKLTRKSTSEIPQPER